MVRHKYSHFLLLLATFVGASIVLFPPVMDSVVYAQDDDGNDNNNQGVVGNAELPGAGVVVDAGGVLRMNTAVDPTGELSRRRRIEAKATLAPELARASKLRKISLNRLEAALGQRIRDNAGVTEEMMYLAGLTRIKYVFLYPETQDIVLAGPAEGFMMDVKGRPVGIYSERATLQLDDLIVALRAYSPAGNRTKTVGVSIDPTPEGLTRMQQFLQQIGSRALPRDTNMIVNGLQESLGLQTVSVRGISPNTHFAHVLVEADYRMKLIGIGLERPAVKIPSYAEKANPAAVSRNALQRWYFVPDYESVRMSDDGMAMELEGDGVKLVGADELVRSDGTRVSSKKADRASSLFVTTFTRKYPELARKEPVYAQMRNLIDMLVTAAYIQEQDFYGATEWSMEVFSDEQMYPVEKFVAPTKVGTAVNAIWKGRTLVTPVGGGVHINAMKAIAAANADGVEDTDAQDARESVSVDNLADGQWWWD